MTDMQIKIENNINVPKRLKKLRGAALWKYTAAEWWRLISVYTPMMSGNLRNNVTIGAGEIKYNSPYSHFIYEGKAMVDPHTGSAYARKAAHKVYSGGMIDLRHNKNPLSSRKWDKAAEPVQKPKLIRSMQKLIDNGGISLND